MQVFTKSYIPYREKSHQNITSCTTSISTQATPEDQVDKFWDELKMVGLPDDTDVQALFEPTGNMLVQKYLMNWMD